MTEFFHPKTLEDYEQLWEWLESLSAKDKDQWMEALRYYSKQSLYFFGRYIISDGATTIHSQFPGKLLYHHKIYVDAAQQYERHIEMGSSLDCSFRGNGKSYWRSKCVPLWLMVNNPDISIFLFSVEKQLGKKHFKVLERELSFNKKLQLLFPDVIWEKPREYTKENGIAWSIGEGLCVNRKITRASQTFEVHSFFSPPIGTRPDMILLDDIESSFFVDSPEKIEKLDAAFSEVTSLLTPVAVKKPILMIHNTRFSQAGLIQRIKDRYEVNNPDSVRATPAEDLYGNYEDSWTGVMGSCPLGGAPVYPATADGLWRQYEEKELKSEYALQFALEYKDPTTQHLDENKIIYYQEDPKDLGRSCVSYLLIDPSHGKVDPSSMQVLGITPDNRKIWLDGIARKLDPTKDEFFDHVYILSTKWDRLSQRMVAILVEDVAHSTYANNIEKEMHKRGCFIPVYKITAKASHKKKVEGLTGKNDKIYTRFNPWLNRAEFWCPLPVSKLGKGLVSADDRGVGRDLVDYWLNTEVRNFPRGKHDDILDSFCLLEDEDFLDEHPLQRGLSSADVDRMEQKVSRRYGKPSWMSA